MGFSDHFEDNDGYNDFLQNLLDNGHLEITVEGVTKKVISEGLESLSSKQKRTFEAHVGEYIFAQCSRGSCDIPWSEMYKAYENGGMCSRCAHMDEEDD